jgi:hypothetical protein
MARWEAEMLPTPIFPQRINAHGRISLHILHIHMASDVHVQREGALAPSFFALSIAHLQ